jgi:quercetin dioxygenase-like cupin family protein
MTSAIMKKTVTRGAITLALLASATVLVAQAPLFQRTMVGKGDVSVPGREAVVGRAEVLPGGRSGRHTHPGDEISYVLEGEVTLLIDGQAAQVKKAGDSFVIPAGVVHEAHNASTAVSKVLAVYVVEKGKPLATPAP